jgi:hypothetical protein
MCKCNFVYTHKKSMSFPVPVFVKLSNVQQHHVQISCTKFNLNLTANVESMDRILIVALSKVWFLLHWFSWTHNDSMVLCARIDNLYQISPKSVKNYGNYRYKIYFLPQVKFSCHWVNFHKTCAYSTTYIMWLYAEFRENLLNSLVVDARSQKDEWTFYLFSKERLKTNCLLSCEHCTILLILKIMIFVVGFHDISSQL